MKPIILSLLSILAFFSSHCQDTISPITFTDPSSKEIVSNEHGRTFFFNQKKDSLVFAHLMDNGFNYQFPIFNSKQPYETTCQYDPIKVVDSIDITKDGVKELFLLRKCNCTAIPLKKDNGLIEFVVRIGTKQYHYSQYEIVNPISKKKIFSIKNRSEMIETTSTSCINSGGYRFTVKINKNGSLIFSNPMGNCKVEMGKYKFKNGIFVH